MPNETVDTLYFYIDTFLNQQLEEDELDALNIVNAILRQRRYTPRFLAPPVSAVSCMG